MAHGFDELATLALVAREQSFTRASQRLGISRSAVSQTITGLEARLGVRLLDRSTRRVVATEAGERLLKVVAPRLEEIEAVVAAVKGLRERPGGTVRITAGEHAVRHVLQPCLARLLPSHPDLRVDIAVGEWPGEGLMEGFDAKIRSGAEVERDLIALRVGPDFRMAVVGAPAYFAKRSAPETPEELTRHSCIRLTAPPDGPEGPWRFVKDDNSVSVRVEGQLRISSLAPCIDFALQGLGVAYLPEDIVAAHVAWGELTRVLVDWSPMVAGYHLHYAANSRSRPGLALLVDALERRQGA